MPRPARQKTVRKDPSPRPVEFGSHMDVAGKQPDRHYVWAYLNDVETGREYYETIGYEVCTYAPGGPRPRFDGNKKKPEGEEIVGYGCVLMSCPKERRDDIEENGAFGNGGMTLAEELERRITEGRSGMEQVAASERSRTGKPYFQTANETSARGIGL